MKKKTLNQLRKENDKSFKILSSDLAKAQRLSNKVNRDFDKLIARCERLIRTLSK